MHTRSQTRNLHNQQHQVPPPVVEPFNLENPLENPPPPPPPPMDDQRTMAQLLEAPTELKHGLINLVQNKQFFGHDKEDPHAHIRYFNKITSTMKFPNVPIRNSRNKAVVAKVSSNSSTPGISPDVAALTTEVSELKNMMKTMLVEKQKAQAPALVKVVEPRVV
ncbi:hypothetical protein Tco_0415531 [Tanacetum coccineum]